MKRMVCILSVLVFLFCSSWVLTVQAATEPESIDYKNIFDQAMTLPIKEEEAYIAKLEELFISDKTAFLDALAEMDKSTIEVVIFTWNTGKTYEEICHLRDVVLNADEDSKYAAIVAALNNEIGLMQYIDIMDPYMQYDNPDSPFSIPLLMRFIDLNIENYTLDHDEGFNQMLASAYEASPVIVAEILCNYSEQEVNNLAKCIAADYKKCSRSIPSPSYDEQPEDIAHIIRTIQYEIHNTVNSQPSNDESAGNDSTEITYSHSIVLITALACMFSLVLIAIILKKSETH